MRVHHVFPYDPGHLGLTLEQWWAGQQRRWPLAAVAESRAAPDTVVHVISRRSQELSSPSLGLRVHGTWYDNARWHEWGDDWSLSLSAALRGAGRQDIVVVHLESYAAARLALRFSHGARTLLVLHGRGTGSWEDHEAADRIVLLREDAMRTLLDSGVPGGALEMVIPSVDRRVFRSTPDAEPGGPVVIGYVGRLEESKGVFELADLLRDIADLSPRLECVGSARTAADRERAEAVFEGLPVELSGELAPAQVADRMRSWRVLVIPSYTEGMPLAALEALSSRIPVVAVDGVLPANLTVRPGVVTCARADLAGGVRRALGQSAPGDAAWIPDHAAGGETWDGIYASLPAWRPRHMPSARPLLGRLRRLRW